MMALDDVLDTAARWLTRACEPYSALEPRFWTIPPAYHIQELCFCLLVAAATAALSCSCSHSRSTPPRLPTGRTALETDMPRLPTGRTALETDMGALLLLWLPVNACNKLAVQGMPPSRALVEMCLPCHVYTGLCAFCFLSTCRRARVDGYSLMLHCAWMPLLAVAFPDLSAARAIAAPALRMGSLATFWAHHLTLLAAPVLAHQQASSRLRFAPPPRATGLLQYLAFIYGFVGVLLCGLALATGRNLNYSLWLPPALPDGAYRYLGGARYRLVIGTVLAFVLGPLMRHAVVPLAAGSLRRLGRAPVRGDAGKTAYAARSVTRSRSGTAKTH